MNFAEAITSGFIQNTTGTREIHKDLQKKKLPVDAFEQFVPSSKGKLVNDECFESVVREVYKQIFQNKEEHKSYIKNEIENFFWEASSPVRKD